MAHSEKFATPLRLNIRPSRYFCIWLLFVYTVIVVSLHLTFPRYYFPTSIFSMLLMVGVVYIIRRYASLQHPDAVVRLVWRETDWVLTTRAGQSYEVVHGSDVYANPYLILLLLRSYATLQRGRIFRVVLLPDSLSGGERSQLLTRLNFSRQKE